jgi:hypothetical protein
MERFFKISSESERKWCEQLLANGRHARDLSQEDLTEWQAALDARAKYDTQ